MPKNIMLIDDDPKFLMELGAMIESYGMECQIIANVEAGVAFFAKGGKTDVVVAVIKVKDRTAIDFVDRLMSKVPPAPVVIIASLPKDIEYEIIKHGALEYIRNIDLSPTTLYDALKKAFIRYNSMYLFRGIYERLDQAECKIQQKEENLVK